MSDSQAELHRLANSVMDEAHKTGYALMHANYVERRAPEMPNGKIRGLEANARDIAARLRDSIWSRFESLRFHHGLMISVREQQARRLSESSDHNARSNAILTASWRAHYLFDDLVFNAASLFDYLGNAVWFGFH